MFRMMTYVEPIEFATKTQASQSQTQDYVVTLAWCLDVRLMAHISSSVVRCCSSVHNIRTRVGKRYETTSNEQT